MNARLIAKSDRVKGEVHSSLACNECHLVTDEEIHQAWSIGAKSLKKWSISAKSSKKCRGQNAEAKVPKKCKTQTRNAFFYFSAPQRSWSEEQETNA